jgi:hypothetical protein
LVGQRAWRGIVLTVVQLVGAQRYAVWTFCLTVIALDLGESSHETRELSREDVCVKGERRIAGSVRRASPGKVDQLAGRQQKERVDVDPEPAAHGRGRARGNGGGVLDLTLGRPNPRLSS